MKHNDTAHTLTYTRTIYADIILTCVKYYFYAIYIYLLLQDYTFDQFYETRNTYFILYTYRNKSQITNYAMRFNESHRQRKTCIQVVVIWTIQILSLFVTSVNDTYPNELHGINLYIQ